MLGKKSTERETVCLTNVDDYVEKISQLNQGESVSDVSILQEKRNQQQEKVTVSNITDSIVRNGTVNDFPRFMDEPVRESEVVRSSMRAQRGRKDAD